MGLMIITLLTDFGVTDYFVGAMKGVILSINARAQIVDITHEIAPQAVSAGAFTLLAAYKDFPAGTIHVCVVDPGVGSSRRPVLVVTKDQFFVGPDNGIFSYIYEREESCRVFHLTAAEYFRKPVSATFHGRDIFAPVAAALSVGIAPSEFGEKITDYVRLETLAPIAESTETLTASIIHIDRFGNCITNLTPEHLTAEMFRSGARLEINGHTIKSFRRFFSENDSNPDELFVIQGSAGFLEIAANRSNAAKMLNAQRGTKVKVLKT